MRLGVVRRHECTAVPVRLGERHIGSELRQRFRGAGTGCHHRSLDRAHPLVHGVVVHRCRRDRCGGREGAREGERRAARAVKQRTAPMGNLALPELRHALKDRGRTEASERPYRELRRHSHTKPGRRLVASPPSRARARTCSLALTVCYPSIHLALSWSRVGPSWCRGVALLSRKDY